MNMDLFQPYKRVNYSVGAVYITVLNLPCAVRYKQENVILVGLIPRPHEPEHDINSFLEPLVSELLPFWEGVDFSISSISGKVCVRCSLLCVACDLPAGRKVCGFPGHSAHYGCSQCGFLEVLEQWIILDLTGTVGQSEQVLLIDKPFPFRILPPKFNS